MRRSIFSTPPTRSCATTLVLALLLAASGGCLFADGDPSATFGEEADGADTPQGADASSPGSDPEASPPAGSELPAEVDRPGEGAPVVDCRDLCPAAGATACDELIAPDLVLRCAARPGCGGLNVWTEAYACPASQSCQRGRCAPRRQPGEVGDACIDNLDCGEGSYCNADYGQCTHHCKLPARAEAGAGVEALLRLRQSLFTGAGLSDWLTNPCPAGTRCLDAGVVHGTNRAVCARPCASADECPSGLACVASPLRLDERFCLLTGRGPAGVPCLRSSECASGVCLFLPGVEAGESSGEVGVCA